MNIIKITGKYLDQPILVEKFRKSVPYILSGAGTIYCLHETKSAPPNKKKRAAIRTFSTMGFTIASALAAPKIAGIIFKNPETNTRSIARIKKDNTGLITNFINENKITEDISSILYKAKSKILNFKEIKTLYTGLGKQKNGKEFLNNLIPKPENITSGEIFSKIGELSLLGFIPVLGGILGGIIGDRLTTPHWKEKIPDKIKEGSYQYLANIFLCNIGAGAALGILEKLNIKSKSARALGMITGIAATGIIGGSALANLIGKRVIDPMLHKKSHNKNIYSERKPEAIDIGLHTDDIATVAVMSGLKWIEPALPIMYSVSGYRAGIGYRNGDKPHKHHHHARKNN